MVNAINDLDGPDASTDEVGQAGQALSAARDAANAIQCLCRTTMTRPSMTPAQIDVILAHLAEAAVALPRAARQLGDVVANAQQDHVLEMDKLTETRDPD